MTAPAPKLLTGAFLERPPDGDYSSGVTARALLFALALSSLPGVAAAQAVSQHPDPPPREANGPLPALAGIPLSFRCTAELPLDHPALRRYPGEDALDLAEAAGVDDAGIFIDGALCAYLWRSLETAGAHLAPEDVRLPARGVLTASLQRLWIEGSRVVEQRIGSTIMPVSIPHWALAMSWEVGFDVEYQDEAGGARGSDKPLVFELSGSAEQDDYAALRLDSLLRAASLDTFGELPRVLADDGKLGDLLFAVVPTPKGAPPELGLSGVAADGFWQLLSTESQQRHDSMAFYLASDVLPLPRRVEMARWFLLTDPDVSLRKDALAWLLRLEDPDPKEPFSDELMELLRWLTLRERSSRVRADAVRVLATRPGEQTRELLVAASTDPDRRVADRAVSGLRKEPPPTAAELEETPGAPRSPEVAAWTSALDGRVAPDEPPPKTLVSLALALGGPAAETWLSRWAARGRVEDGDDWAFDAWRSMATHGSLRVRLHTLERLAGKSGDSRVAELLESRIAKETEPSAKVAAIEALSRFERAGLDAVLIEASRSSDVDVRVAAVEALTQVPGANVDKRLERLASDDPTNKVRRKARRALRERAKESWKS